MRCLLALLALPLFAQQISKERALGDKLALDIKQESRIPEDPALLSYVQSVGAELVANLDGSPLPYRFHVIVHSEMTEPMALPGGLILVPVSFLANAKDEGEFAGMMAHAIAHIAARHGRGSQAEQSSAGLVSVPVIFKGGRSGLHAPSSTSSKHTPLGFLKT